MKNCFSGNTNKHFKPDLVISRPPQLSFALTLALLLLAVCSGGCASKPATPITGQTPAPHSTSQSSGQTLELTLLYGSEKELWITDVTSSFNKEQHFSSAGKRIFVKAIPMASGEAIDEILEGHREADLVSPASSVFVELGNRESLTQSGRPLVGETYSLVRSPLVIAMWKPTAERLGWGKKPIAWADIVKLIASESGSGKDNHGSWGKFRFSHTSPQFSSSGLLTLIAEAYAASGKTDHLTLTDLRNPKVVEFLSAIEKAVPYHGSSTGFYGRLMFVADPYHVSAAALYENMVVESYSENGLPYPIVAVYPKEGTLWSDHPIGVVERNWVTPERREASKLYIDYLLEQHQQEKAVAYGFRPSVAGISPGPPLDEAHGVNPNEPSTGLEIPSMPVIEGVLHLWESGKVKHSGM